VLARPFGVDRGRAALNMLAFCWSGLPVTWAFTVYGLESPEISCIKVFRFGDFALATFPVPNLGPGSGVIRPTWNAWYWTLVTFEPASRWAALRKFKADLVFRVIFSGFRRGANWKRLEENLNFPRLSHLGFPVGRPRFLKLVVRAFETKIKSPITITIMGEDFITGHVGGILCCEFLSVRGSYSSLVQAPARFRFVPEILPRCQVPQHAEYLT
jgi:hypothetical protein